MSEGKTASFPGRRVYPGIKPLALREGEYGFNPADGKWYARPPGCHMGSLETHTVTQHEDGTITVTPSILVTDPNDAGNPDKVQWHGYLEHGVWLRIE